MNNCASNAQEKLQWNRKKASGGSSISAKIHVISIFKFISCSACIIIASFSLALVLKAAYCLVTWSLWIKSCPLRIKEVEDEKVEKMEGMETKEAAVTGSVRLTGEYVLFNLLLHCWTFYPAELEVLIWSQLTFFGSLHQCFCLFENTSMEKDEY